MESAEARADRDAAALLAGRALIEIRALASELLREPGNQVLPQQIHFLAGLAHNLPGIARPPAAAYEERPMSWAWNTAGPHGRTWMLGHITQAGLAWTPPPPLAG